MHQWWAMPTLPLHATASGNRGTFSLVPAYPDFRDPHTNTLIHIMNGLHIIHQTKCDFGLFFKPIMSILDQFHWIWEYENTLCNTNLLDAEQLAEYHEMLASLETYGAYRVYIPPGTIFSKYSDKIPNDWCDIYGFSKKPDCENFTQRLDEAKEADNANLTCKIEELLCQGFSDNYDDIAPQGERLAKQLAGTKRRSLFLQCGWVFLEFLRERPDTHQNGCQLPDHSPRRNNHGKGHTRQVGFVRRAANTAFLGSRIFLQTL